MFTRRAKKLSAKRTAGPCCDKITLPFDSSTQPRFLTMVSCELVHLPTVSYAKRTLLQPATIFGSKFFREMWFDAPVGIVFWSFVFRILWVLRFPKILGTQNLTELTVVYPQGTSNRKTASGRWLLWLFLLCNRLLKPSKKLPVHLQD